MRKIQDIESQIEDFEAQVGALTERRSDAEKELESARRAYAKGIVNAETDERSIEHREAVTRLSIEFDAMSAAVDLVREDLQKAETEKKIVLLYQTQGNRFNLNMSSTDQCVSTLNKDLPRLNNLVLSISDTIRNAVSGVEQACSGLDSVAKGLDPTLSLESFLSGHLIAADGEDREDLLNNIGCDLRDSVSSLHVEESPDLAGLQSLIASLIQWRDIISSFQDGSSLIKNRKRLFNPIKKRPKTQHISPPTTTGEIPKRKEFAPPSRLTTKPLIPDAIRQAKRPLMAGM